MAPPTAAPDRQLKHRRSFDVQIHSRGNGLWDVDAEITDVKTHDTRLAGGLRPAGDVHGDVCRRLIGQDCDRRPFPSDGCHALRCDGPAVQTHSPRWYEGAATAARPDPIPTPSET